MNLKAWSHLTLLVVAAGAASGSEPALQTSLAGAVQCVGDPLQTVRTLSSRGTTDFNRGLAAFTYGEEMDQKNILILRTPVVIAGARTSAVVLDFASSYNDFTAIVYGVFEGDFRKVVAQLGLKVVAKSERIKVGTFERSLDVRIDGKADHYCPKTIGLTPLKENEKFLLGCGWCNG